MRSISDSAASIIKAATAASYEAMGGVMRAAEALGVGSSSLTKYASPADDWRDSFIRLDLAVELDRRTGHPFLLNAMIQLVQPEEPKPLGEITAAAILKLDGVLDDVVREVARALEDGRVDSAERQAVRSRIIAAQRDLARLDAMMLGLG